LLARKLGGTFILRIEDTDTERSTAEMTDGIIEAMTWMGLNWDEGPFRQSERTDRYRQLARRLLDEQRAYYCFCSPTELALKREAGKSSRTEWKYDRACLRLDPAHAARKVETGHPAAIRFRVPDRIARFEDQVFGAIEKRGDELEDFVIARSSGQPTYQLSVVADDMDMGITHVVRGADHIANTPKQLLLYEALGAAPPAFAHVPLILASDRSRLSKRHGATSVLAYRDEGVPAEAFTNFLALLGWSDGTDRELFDRSELIQAFSLGGISRSNAVFDADKLSWFSGQYINAIPPGQLVERVRGRMEDAGIWEGRLDASDSRWLESVIELIRPRFRSLNALAVELGTYVGETVEYEPSAVDRFLKDPLLVQYLPMLADRLEAIEPYKADSAERALRALSDELGVKAGLLINASRVALTGKAVAPGIFDVMAALGRQKTVQRLRWVVRRVSFGA
jgi:glutamyl-tRNA synthetase